MKIFCRFLEKIKSLRFLIISVSLVILIVLTVYWQDLSILFNEALQNEAVSHILLIPFLISYLLYRKKEHIEASLTLERLRRREKVVTACDFVGAALCLTAFLLYWYGSYTFYPLEFHIASMILFITGLVLILTSIKTLRILIFPIVFLAFLIPPPSTIVYALGGFLANINTQGSYALLRSAGLPVTLSYNYGAPIIALNTQRGPVEFAVYQASSGLYSLIAFTMFIAFLIYITHGSIIKKAVLLVLGFLILPLLNITRISLIVSVAHWLGEDIAMNIFHTFTGWVLIFAGIFSLLLVGEKILKLQIPANPKPRFFCSMCNSSLKRNEPFCLSCGRFLKVPHLKISKLLWLKLIVLLIGSLLLTISIQAPAFAFAPRLVISNPNPQANTSVFPNITDYRLEFLYRDERYERVARQDASLIYAYKPRNSSEPQIYVIVGVATSVSSLHNWEVSLIAWRIAQGLPPLVTLLDQGDVQLTENPRIIARYIVFRHPSNYIYVAIYWYQRALFKTGLTVEPRYVRINLLIITKSLNNKDQILGKLQTIGRKIAVHWEPLKVQSLFSLGIPVQQALLGLTAIAAIFIQTSQYTIEQRRKRTNLKIFERFASPKEKMLYQTIKQLSQKTKGTTTKNIALAFKKAVGEEVKLEKLNDMLKNLEEHGIIKPDLINIHDQPMLVWKT
jgi:exosortase